MANRIWTGAVAAKHRGGFTAVGAWLRTPTGLFVWRHAERHGPLLEKDAAKLGLGSLIHACAAHRTQSVEVSIYPLDDSERLGRLSLIPREDEAAVALAESTLPAPPEFEAVGLEYVEPGHYIAHGRQDYQVWTKLGVCSCPAFTFGATRPCKHLKVALEIERRVS